MTHSAPPSDSPEQTPAAQLPERETPVAIVDGRSLRIADREQLVSSVRYAMTWDERGKPRTIKARENPESTARWIVENLLRSNYVVLQVIPPIVPAKNYPGLYKD